MPAREKPEKRNGRIGEKDNAREGEGKRRRERERIKAVLTRSKDPQEEKLKHRSHTRYPKRKSIRNREDGTKRCDET